MMDTSDASPTPPIANTNAQESTETPPSGAYQPPRVEPLGTLPASTGMPVSQFQLGDEPVR